jgi:hypothetical protein
VAYGGAISAGAIWDDKEFISANPAVRSLERPWRFFTDPWTTTPFGGSFLATYRPLRTLLYAVQYRLFEGDAWAYHLVSLLLHLLAAVGVAALTRRLFGRGSWFAAGLWLIHPLQVEIAVNLAAQGNLLCVGAVVWALERHVAQLEGRGRRPWLWAVLLTAVACLSYESGVLLPLLVLFVELVWSAGGRSFPSRWPTRWAPYVATVGAYLLLRSAVVVPAGPTAWWGGSWWGGCVLQARLWLNAWSLMLVPIGIVPRYVGDELPFWVMPSVAIVFHLGLVAGLVWWWRRRGRVLPVVVAWWYLAQLPTANILVALLGYPFSSRMLFLALVLPVTAAASSLATWFGRRPALALLAAVWLLGALSEDRRIVHIWQSPRTFFGAIAEARPGDDIAAKALAMEALAAGELDRAANLATEAARSEETSPAPPYIVAEVARRRGDLAAARNAYLQALKRHRTYLPALLAYADLELAAGNAQRVLTGLEPLVALKGVSAESAAQIAAVQAQALQRLGRCPEGTARAGWAGELWPWDAALLFRAARVLRACGERERAYALFRRSGDAAAEQMRAQLAPAT